MGYRTMGRMHTALLGLMAVRRREEGQGTVEYVGLILLIAAVIGGVVVAGKGSHGGGIDKVVIGQLKDAIDGVGGGKTGP